MSDLRSVVYVSTATELMSEPQLESLLTKARRFNLETNTTGVLLYADGNFMQYIEGSEEAIKVTYARICKSSQHSGLIELLNEPVPRRAFPHWRMGFKKTKKSELLSLSSAQWREGQTPPSSSDSSGVALIKKFFGDTPR